MSFLSDREAVILAAGLMSPEIDTGGTGTPQRVIFPMLFNVVLMGFPRNLNHIETLNQTIYSDDSCIWVCDALMRNPNFSYTIPHLGAGLLKDTT